MIKTISMKAILRFLFPEVQILDAIKQDGFVTKRKGRENAISNKQFGIGDLSFQSKEERSTPFTPKTQPRNKQSVERRFAPKNTINADKIEKKFDGVENLLRQNWVASQKNVHALCQAMKRPFIMGIDENLPKNTILITGNESHGKETAIKQICSILAQRRVLRYSDVPIVDFGLYSTDTEGELFLNDLYQALYMRSEVVVFENIDKSDYRSLNVIFQLMKNGTYHLPKRYVVQNNMLVESTGTLNTTSVSGISANSKYFIFLSTCAVEQIADHVGKHFFNVIHDVIVLDEFSKAELREIVESLAKQLCEKAKKQLQISINFDESGILTLMNNYQQESGVKGLQETIDEHIFMPLTEYRMQNPPQNDQDAVLKFEGSYRLYFENTYIDLVEFEKHFDCVALEVAKQELEKVIGLSAVKDYVLSLENNLTVQRLRKTKGLKNADLSMNMIFVGNPGTGKTTIARIIAKYLKAIGVLSSGQLREVSRSDLVGQYVGQTAKQTADIISSALGGVLFIDEAYALCRDKNDIFGLEAIDALVKGIEDHRDNLVVILAGYSDEMEQFMNLNPGLKSRFPNVVQFEDYTSEEMYQIAEVTANSKGYRLADECRTPLLDEFERTQIKGRNDSGNGRFVRNIIEKAILNQSQRISRDQSQDLVLLTAEDFCLHEKAVFDLEKELSSIVGLENVKDFIRTQYHVQIAREKRKKADLNVDTTQTLNMVFTGNPGTGKTTMARVVAEMFHSMGLLKSGHLVETDKGGLIAEYVGQTAKKTEEVFRSALGGVLFIDEAYAITNDGSSFGQECIDTLVKLLEDYRGELLVILAGYSKEMDEFLQSNSGLESRFPLRIEFPDYSAEELIEIGKGMISNRGFSLSEEAAPVFDDAIISLKRHSTATSGNGRMVRNFIDEIIRNQSSRIALTDAAPEEMTVILADDIDQKLSREEFDLESELRKVVGLESVKNYIRSLNARLLIQEQRKNHGLKVNSIQTLHMIFVGNPGTGKTMMARTIAKLLYCMGIISTDKLVETDRSGLVAGYVGQTAMKTRRIIESALGGVLFVDEAYALAQGGTNDFGQEAIDTLVKMMDDNRDRLVVILAGYPGEMQGFLEQNAGLKSRFPNIIEFEDYSTSELLGIAEKMYEEQGYILSEDARDLLVQVFASAKKQPQFGNGRYVRNIIEKSINCQAVRLTHLESLSANDLSTITLNDIEEVTSA